MLKHIVHYRESPDSIQWDEEFDSKSAADKRALEIFLNGGIAIVVDKEVPDEIHLGPIPSTQGNDDDLPL